MKKAKEEEQREGKESKWNYASGQESFNLNTSLKFTT